MSDKTIRHLSLLVAFVFATSLFAGSGGPDQRPIEIDPDNGGNIAITDNDNNQGPGDSGKLRSDVAKTKYAICWYDGRTVHEVSEVTYVTRKTRASKTVYDFIRLEQTAPRGETAVIKLFVGTERIGNSRNERCPYTGNDKCKDAGLPGELDGVVDSMYWKIKGGDWKADKVILKLEPDDDTPACS